MKRSVAAGVFVVAGVVAFNFGGLVGELPAGAGKVFADEGEVRPALPPGMRGFRGLLVGTIVSKGRRYFVLKVESIAALWPSNRADKPGDTVGKPVLLSLWPKSRLYELHLNTLARLERGERVIVEAFHLEGERLHVADTLRPAEAAAEYRLHPQREEARPPREGERAIRREREAEGREGRALRRDRERREGEERVIRRDREGAEREGPQREDIRRREEGREERVIRRDREGERREGAEREGARRREAAANLEDAVKGFRGLLQGLVVGKGERALVIKVQEVARVWQTSTARNPQALAGKTITLEVPAGQPAARLLKALAELKVGDRTLVAVAHIEGNRLGLVEVLKKSGSL